MEQEEFIIALRKFANHNDEDKTQHWPEIKDCIRAFVQCNEHFVTWQCHSEQKSEDESDNEDHLACLMHLPQECKQNMDQKTAWCIFILLQRLIQRHDCSNENIHTFAQFIVDHCVEMMASCIQTLLNITERRSAFLNELYSSDSSCNQLIDQILQWCFVRSYDQVKVDDAIYLLCSIAGDSHHALHYLLCKRPTFVNDLMRLCNSSRCISDSACKNVVMQMIRSHIAHQSRFELVPQSCPELLLHTSNWFIDACSALTNDTDLQLSIMQVVYGITEHNQGVQFIFSSPRSLLQHFANHLEDQQFGITMPCAYI